MPYADIVGIGSYRPDRILTNADLEQMVETSDEWITTRTGIRERRIVADDQATSDMAIEASRRAIADAGIDPTTIDQIIVATSTPDQIMPSTACIVAGALGLTSAAYDVNAACTGFIYALHAAAAAIESGRARAALVIGADTLSRFTDFTDRATCVLFGDGAGAVVLSAGEEPGVLAVEIGADGSGADLLGIPATGSRVPVADADGVVPGPYIRMNGQEIFKFAVRAIPSATRHVLAASQLDVEHLDWLVPHQANQRIIATIAERLDMPEDRVVSNIAEVGNTSAASIPLALDDLYTARRLRAGHHLALVGFGAGLTWGAAVVRWTKEAC
jgi:3-oxoacyl-[acyl-carrier-protein] synthase-3